jgi:hypothetical protein
MEDLAGGPVTPRRKEVDFSLLPEPKRPEDEEVDLSYKQVYQVKQGVPVRWLALVFGMTEHHVKSRLKDLRPIGTANHANPIYSVADAAAYLVQPKVNITEFLRGLKDDDLPDDLRLKLWNARRVRNQVLEAEGELWHSNLALEKFAEVLLAIREKLQLIPEKVERMTGISPEQYKLIRAIVDGVQEEMYRTILDMADKDKTPSVLGSDEEEVMF